MAFTGRKVAKKNEYTLLTDSDVVALSVQNLDYSGEIWLIAMPDTTPPTNTDRGIRLDPEVPFSETLADWWRDIDTGRVFAWCTRDISMFVSHA
ncbi:hypothetical protein P775_08495 [Puniceibacterium antarcticum]|uniref:Uncharacterized protein n=1 Tax=Puniceibacterium antarcticum TaxID=1206336 RepID=A0A2G8RHJ9_9RHOB|nr:hypothetical protein [Puniceibacterium antarcticum]PIL20558.1 hypothetical protein P775_08495 [Puniceibacterium antarcticum]